MKRTAFDERQDRQIADDYLANHMACSFCRSMTPNSDLAIFGARCQACYAEYTAARNPSWWPNRPLKPHERAAVIRRAREAVSRIGAAGARDPRQWARDLKAREESGERLTIAQRDSWRYALRGESGIPETDADAICTSCGQTGHRAHNCPWPIEASEKLEEVA